MARARPESELDLFDLPANLRDGFILVIRNLAFTT
jgi:hypothetical protein